MVAVGGAFLARGWSAVDAQLVHPAADAFAVYRPVEPAHHDGEPPVAVGRPFAGQIQQGALEHGLVVEGRTCRVVNGTARHAEQLAELMKGMQEQSLAQAEGAEGAAVTKRGLGRREVKWDV